MKINFKNKFLKSLRFRVLIILIVVGLVPTFVMKYGIIKGYEDRTVQYWTETVKKQCDIISTQIGSGEMSESLTSEGVHAEISQLANVYEGRILVVDKNFRILKDTYGLDEGKTIITDSIVQCFREEETSFYDSKNNYIGITSAIKDSVTKDIVGVMLTSISTTNVVESMDALSTKATFLQIGLMFFALIIAYFLSGVLVRPFGKVTTSIEELTDGIVEDKISIPDYTETQLISEAFNKMLARMKVLDESRQEFVSNVSHELKTPITSMKVLADSLIAQEDVPAELYKEFMVDIAQEIERENKIINDLLSLVKMDRKASDLNIQEININELIELILKRLRPIAQTRKIELILESFRPVTAEADETKLTLAISNLVENAIKYNKDEGWVHISLNADNKYVYIKVADSGMGIPEESLEHVFERFYRVDKSHSKEIGGTGLGLAIARNAVLMHRGAVKVYSKEGEGTTFTVRIPLVYNA